MPQNQLNRRNFLNTGAAFGAALSAPSLIATPAHAFSPRPRMVKINKGLEVGRIYIVPSSFYLYLVTEQRKALRYGVGVGQAGREFTGVAEIKVKKEWPTWRPTDEMIEREPHKFPMFIGNEFVQPGGRGNPLGARALYLFQNGVDTYFRIHGTNEPKSIGQTDSSGCIRMLNAHVIDLYERVPIGTVVTVL